MRSLNQREINFISGGDHKVDYQDIIEIEAAAFWGMIMASVAISVLLYMARNG